MEQQVASNSDFEELPFPSMTSWSGFPMIVSRTRSGDAFSVAVIVTRLLLLAPDEKKLLLVGLESVSEG